MKELIELAQRSLKFKKEAGEILGDGSLVNTSFRAHGKYEIAVQTASLDEFDSIKKHFSELNELKIENDNNIFFEGIIQGKSKKLKAIIPVPSAMGIEAAVSLATKTLTYFKPSYIFMVGICAGNKKVTKIGDIIIAEKALNYNEIVEVEKRDESTVKKFMQNADSINTKFKTRLKMFSRSSLIKDIRDNYSDKAKISDELSCKIGLIVTGSSLVRSESKIEEINESYHNIKGLDMETHGFYYTACNTFDEYQPYFVSIKSVSDFGDNTKHKLTTDQRREYALYTSSLALVKIIQTEI